MCREFGALPEAGGVMDQPVWVLKMRAILQLSGYFDDEAGPSPGGGGGSPRAPQDPLADIPMTTLG